MSGEIKEDFPRYKMLVDNKEFWLTIQSAGEVYDSGFVEVVIGNLALEVSGETRPITYQEMARITEIADEVSANK